MTPLVRQLRAATGADGAALLLTDEDGRFVVAAVDGVTIGAGSLFVPPTEPVVGKLAESHGVHCIPVVDDEPSLFARWGWRLAVGAPLRRGVDVCGVVVAGGGDPASLAEAPEIVALAAEALTAPVLDHRPRVTAPSHRHRTGDARAVLLDQAAVALDASLDYDTTLRNVARVMVPAFADQCFVDVVEDGDLRLVTVAHVDPRREQMMLDLRRRWPPTPDHPNVATFAATAAGPHLFREVPDTVWQAIAQDDDHLRALRELDARSGMVVPLVSRGRVLGTVILARTSESSLFDEDDMAFGMQVANRCAVAVDAARLHREVVDALADRDRLLDAEQRARADAEEGQRRLAFLAEASARLESSLDLHSTLTQAGSLAVPRLADGCLVHLTDRDGLVLSTVAHTDEAVEGAVRAATGRPVGPDHPVAAAARTMSTVVVDASAPEWQAAVAEDDALAGLARAGIGTAMFVPMLVHSEPIGVLTLGLAGAERQVTTADLNVAQELARRVAFAVDNARLYAEAATSSERYRSIARILQESLLPPTLPVIPGVDVAAYYRPAGDGTIVGGDFYDVFPTRTDEWGVLVGDVAGKGPQAAASTALTRYVVRGATIGEHRPSRVLSTANEAIFSERDDRLCTAVYARLRPVGHAARLTLARAGHPAPLLIRVDGTVAELGSPGLPLGAFRAQEPPDEVVLLDPGELVLLFTDGVTDARRGDEPFGDARLVEVVREVAGGTAEELVDAVARAVREWSEGEPVTDDIAVLGLRVTG